MKRIKIEFDWQSLAIGLIGGKDVDGGYFIAFLLPFFWVSYKVK